MLLRSLFSPDILIEEDVTLEEGEALGSGAFGDVRVAVWKGTRVAAKRLHAIFFDKNVVPFDQSQLLLQEFAAECSLLAQLRHPHIVQLCGVHIPPTEDGKAQCALMISELMCETLRKHILNSPRLTVRDIVDVATEVSSALKYLHEREQPIAHRDLSSTNIMLTSSGTCKIVDVGLARVFTDAARKATTIKPGHENYMPGEVLSQGTRYDERIDVFSLGVVILEMAVGHEARPDKVWLKPSPEGGAFILVAEHERRQKEIDELYYGYPLTPLILSLLEPESQRPVIGEVYRKLLKLATTREYTSQVTTLHSTESAAAILSRQIQETEERLRQRQELTEKQWSDAHQELTENQRELENRLQTSTEELTTNQNEHHTKLYAHQEHVQREVAGTHRQIKELVEASKEEVLQQVTSSQDRLLMETRAVQHQSMQQQEVVRQQLQQQLLAANELSTTFHRDLDGSINMCRQEDLQTRNEMARTISLAQTALTGGQKRIEEQVTASQQELHQLVDELVLRHLASTRDSLSRTFQQGVKSSTDHQKQLHDRAQREEKSHFHHLCQLVQNLIADQGALRGDVQAVANQQKKMARRLGSSRLNTEVAGENSLSQRSVSVQTTIDGSASVTQRPVRSNIRLCEAETQTETSFPADHKTAKTDSSTDTHDLPGNNIHSQLSWKESQPDDAILLDGEVAALSAADRQASLSAGLSSPRPASSSTPSSHFLSESLRSTASSVPSFVWAESSEGTVNSLLAEVRRFSFTAKILLQTSSFAKFPLLKSRDDGATLAKLTPIVLQHGTQLGQPFSFGEWKFVHDLQAHMLGRTDMWHATVCAEQLFIGTFTTYNGRFTPAMFYTRDTIAWHPLASPQDTRACQGLFSYQSHVYGLFLPTSEQDTNRHLVIYKLVDQEGCRWERVRNGRFPHKQYDCGIVVTGNCVWFVAGFDGKGNTCAVTGYNMAAEDWCNADILPSALPSAVSNSQIVHDTDTIHLLGGNELVDGKELPQNRVFSCTVAPQTGEWKNDIITPTPHGWCAAACVNGCLVAAGGGPDGAMSADVFCWDPKVATWLEFPPLPCPRQRPTLVQFGKKLVCIGGWLRTGGRASWCSRVDVINL